MSNAESNGGQIRMGAAIDYSSFDADLNHIQDGITRLGTMSAAEGQRIAQVLANVPTVNIEVVTNASQSLSTIDAAFAEIDRVVDLNESAIKELEAEYDRLGVEAKAAYEKGTAAGDREYAAINKHRQAISSSIGERKKVVQAAMQQSDELLKVEQNLKKEAAALQNTATKQASFRSQLMNARNEMRQMAAAGQQNTEAYEQVRQKVVELTQAMNASNKQVKALSSPTAQFQGIMSGLSGITGAYSVASGAMGLFAGENEDLQRIMTKVQSLMSITMGLQQMQTTLNKNSAFSMVTLNGLKEWWNKLLAIGRGEQIAETAATAANTAATGTNTAATVADTVAQQANNMATEAGTASLGQNTAGQIVNTGAAEAGTVANIGLAGAFRMVGAAIKTALGPIGLIAAAVGAIIAVVTHYINKIKETKKAQEKWNKSIADNAAEPIAKIEELSSSWGRLGNNIKEKEEFIKKNKDAFDELGVSVKGVEDAENLLVKNKDRFILAQIAKAKALAWVDMASQKAKELISLEQEYQSMPDTVQQFVPTGSGMYGGSYGTYTTVANKEKAELKKQIEAYKKDMRTMFYNAAVENSNAAFNLRKGGIQEVQNKETNTKNTTTSTDNKFDYKRAALEQKKAIQEREDAVKTYQKEAQQAITEANIEVQEDGQAKEIAQIRNDTKKKKAEWEQQLSSLAETVKNSYKDYYMAQKGATEVGWSNSKRGKMSVEEYKKELLENEANRKLYNEHMAQIEAEGGRQIAAVRKKYNDELIDQYGTEEQKRQKLQTDWMEKLKSIPKEFQKEAIRQMDEQFSALATADFKKTINWEAVFGDMGKQSIETLRRNLEKVRAYFNQNKADMGATDIKDFQQGIASMEKEIASRNPFTALAKSVQDLKKYQQELSAATKEYVAAQDALAAAQTEYNMALSVRNMLEEQMRQGKLPGDALAYKSALEAVTAALEKLNKAKEQGNNAESKALAARNGVIASYKDFATQLKAAGGVVTDLGSKAKNLAEVFSGDVAQSMEEAIGVITTMLDAASTVIDSIKDIGKTATKAIVGTVDASAQAVDSTSKAAAASMSTLEKASMILTIVSAALQVATAIASMFNDDDMKQKEIDNLQQRIDQLQWELDNAAAVRLQSNTGDAVKRVKDIYDEAYRSVLKLNDGVNNYGGITGRIYKYALTENEAMKQSVGKLADYYANVSYTADKALGEERYSNARKQIENIAEQQVLLQKQIDEESSKKNADNGKIADWERQMQENAEEMVSIINNMMDEIIGYTAEDLAKTLGDAFVEASKKGEDAMEAWHNKVNEIVADIVKRMMIQKYLEPMIGGIFDKYKEKWFGKNGDQFNIDAVTNSMTDFQNDLNEAGDKFKAFYDALPQELKDKMEGDAERTGTSKGIATASQDSVDENNARLTTIQGHTYSINQGVIELNRTGNAMLVKLTAIEDNTARTNDKLDTMNANIRNIKSNVDDIQTKGLKLRS